MLTVDRPLPNEVVDFFQAYVAKASGNDLFTALDHALERSRAVAVGIAPDREEYRYAEGKWSIKEVFQHITDTERILSYRALRFARNDATELAGFEENDYVALAETERRSLKDLLEEHIIVRTSTIALFRSFSADMLTRTGVANGNRNSVRALGWSIAGHALHHMDIIDQRYR
ncbi:MAG TPA: DinB family protein [Flavobacteriales bacterium]|nr:DinB family protein [Flavobacteriales bacterium]